MCKFLSVLVLRNGDIKWHPMLDSHSDLVRYFKLPDKQHTRHFAKVEFTPASDKDGVPQYADYKAYTMRVDEATEPAWFAEHRDSVEKKLRSIVKAMIIDDDTVPLVLDGCRILVAGASVDAMHGGRAYICGGTVNDIRGGTVNDIRGGTVNAIWGGTVNAIRGGTVNAICGGTVNAIRGGTVNAIRGGTVNDIRGGTVNAIWGGTVNAIWGGTVNDISDYANVPASHKPKTSKV